MEKNSFTEIGNSKASAPIVLSKMLRLSQITGGFIVDQEQISHQVGTEKILALKELLQTYTYPARKVVVFARFLWEIDRIVQACRELHLPAEVLSGSIPTTARDKAIDRFRDDPKCLAFIAQIATGSLGIDLSKAPIAIFYSRDYDYGHYTQSCDRIICKEQKALYLHIIAKNTVDELEIGRVLMDKETFSDAIVEYRRRRNL
jgi:SNF2 family DNA or RNA helicase